MVLFKLAAGRGQREKALRLHKTLDMHHYMPETVQWIEETVAEIGRE